MSQGDKKNRPVNFSREEKDPGNLKKEKNCDKEHNNETQEVDDKLIGDDLEIEEAQHTNNDKEDSPDKKENNY